MFVGCLSVSRHDVFDCVCFSIGTKDPLQNRHTTAARVGNRPRHGVFAQTRPKRISLCTSRVEYRDTKKGKGNKAGHREGLRAHQAHEIRVLRCSAAFGARPVRSGCTRETVRSVPSLSGGGQRNAGEKGADGSNANK